MQNRDLVARVIGLVVFTLGIAILVVSFVFAYRLFTSTGIAIAPGKPGGPSASVNLGSSAIVTLARIGALFIIVLVGSLIASRGVQMYFAGERVPKIEE